jgi:short-subunit dehydrogenase
MKKVILITGASSGIGKATAEQLLSEGHIVYAAARRLEKMSDLKDKGAIPIAMDVSQEETIKKGIDQIIKEQGKIDVLFNNAGFGLYGAVEDIPIDDARYQFEVNLFGLARATQLVLPHMRKQGSGRIINTSSMGGKIYTPLGAWYHATKHAVEGWSDCLRLEVSQFGIDVVVIEPGMIRTNFGAVVGSAMQKYIKGSAYYSMIEPYIKMMEDPKMEKMGTDPSVLAKEIVKAVNAKKPKTRYVKGQMARLLLFIRKYFGDRVFDKLIMKIFSQ